MSVRMLVLNDPPARSDVPTEQLYSPGRLCPDPGMTVNQNNLKPARTEIGSARVIVTYLLRVNAILHTDLRTRFVGTPVHNFAFFHGTSNGGQRVSYLRPGVN